MNTSTLDIYGQICSMLLEQNIAYRTILHPPEGNTKLASQIRGHDLNKAAKSLAIEVKIKRGIRKYLLAVVRGDRLVDMKAIKKIFNAYDSTLVSEDKAISLTACPMGAVPPFTFHKELLLIVDREITLNDEIVFNAGLLETSIVLQMKDYFRVVTPDYIEHISKSV